MFVDGIGVGAGFDQADDSGRLRRRVPRARTRTANSGGMQCLVAEAIPCVDACSRNDELSHYFCLVRCRGDVQCRVAREDISPNLIEVVWLLRLPSGSRLKART